MSRPLLHSALFAFIAGFMFACQTTSDITAENQTVTDPVAENTILEPTVTDRIASIADQYQIKVGVAATNFTTGKSLSINAFEQIPITSMIKVPVLMAVYQAIQDGKLTRDQKVMIDKKDIVGGSGIIRHLKTSYTFTVEDLGRMMVIDSDNSATNALLSLLGPTIDEQTRAVNSLMVKYGLLDTRLQNKFLRTDLQPASIETAELGVAFSTAADLIKLIGILYTGRFINQSVSDEILTIMKVSNDDTMAPRFLPVGEPGFSIAHRSGGTFVYKGDFGLISWQGESIGFSVICENLVDNKQTIENSGILAVGLITKLVFEELTKKAD